jgi:CBS domain-containing protein
MKVSDVMSREIEVVHPEAMLAEAAAKMQQLNVGILPVVDGDTLLGVLTDRDITLRATAAGQDPRQTTVQQAMTQDLVYCFEDQDVGEAARLMQDQQIRRLVVLNREKQLVGIVSLGDVAVETANDRLAGQVLERVSQPVHPPSSGRVGAHAGRPRGARAGRARRTRTARPFGRLADGVLAGLRARCCCSGD